MKDTCTSDSVNPWGKIPETPPFVLPEDKSSLESYNNSPNNESCRFELNIYPEPYAGRIDANVLILARNPALKQENYEEHRNESYKALWRANVAQTEKEYPLFYLHPNLKDFRCQEWRVEKIGSLIEELGMEAVAQSVLEVQWFPYHRNSCKRVFPDCKNTSQKFAFHLVEAAMKRGAIIVVQYGEHWRRTHPELFDYKHMIKLKSKINGKVTPGNIADGRFDEIIQAIKK